MLFLILEKDNSRGRRKEEVATRVINTLVNLFSTRDIGLGGSSFWPSDPYRVLITAVLSQRTKDEHTVQAVSRLFNVYPTVDCLAEASPDDIKVLIRGVAYYKTKANRIRQLARIIKDKHSGRLPADRGVLLDMPGVGMKTADCVLLYGFGKPVIPIDTHVRRISKRIGLIDEGTARDPGDYVELQRKLYEIFLSDHWSLVNPLFVKFGQAICKASAPNCRICSVTNFCKSYANNRG